MGLEMEGAMQQAPHPGRQVTRGLFHVERVVMSWTLS
jgi:hypothetical protein